MGSLHQEKDVSNCIRNIMLILLSIIALFIYFYWRHKLQYWERRRVPQSDNTNIIFGDFKNGILLRSPPGYHLGEIYRKAPKETPYFGFYIFHNPCLLLKDPELIKQILIRDFDKFADRHFAGSEQKDTMGMINLFGLKTPAWNYLRRRISPLFTGKKLKQMLPLMMKSGKSMMTYLKKNCDDSNGTGNIDAQDVNFKYAADLIANIALGVETDSVNNPYTDYAKTLLDFFYGIKRKIALVIVFFMPMLVKVIGSPIFFNTDYVQKIFWNAVEYREKTGNKRGDYIDTVIELKNQEQDPIYRFQRKKAAKVLMSKINVAFWHQSGDDGGFVIAKEGEETHFSRDEFEENNLLYQSGIFFSGFESSATTAAFTLMELAKNKTYQDSVRDEVTSAIERYGWTVEAFNEMKYLDQCIAESHRLYPPLLTIDRIALEDYEIPETDMVIEKGTPLFISLHGLHTDSQYFDEPKTYNPDRFSNIKNVSPAYMPFGAGPRACVGMKAGLLHIKVAVSIILSEYEVYLNQKEIVELDTRSTFTSAAKGINIKIKRLYTKINN